MAVAIRPSISFEMDEPLSISKLPRCYKILVKLLCGGSVLALFSALRIVQIADRAPPAPPLSYRRRHWLAVHRVVYHSVRAK